MAGSSYGNIFRVTTWGESHGKGLGVVVDGVPAGLELCEEDIQIFLNRRKPGQSKFTTPRKEDDAVEKAMLFPDKAGGLHKAAPLQGREDPPPLVRQGKGPCTVRVEERVKHLLRDLKFLPLRILRVVVGDSGIFIIILESPDVHAVFKDRMHLPVTAAMRCSATSSLAFSSAIFASSREIRRS